MKINSILHCSFCGTKAKRRQARQEIKDFEEKFNIDNRTQECCSNYLTEYEKNYKKDYDEYFGSQDKLTYEKIPSFWTDSLTCGHSLVSRIKILKDKEAIALYSALYNNNGVGCDDWLASLK